MEEPTGVEQSFIVSWTNHHRSLGSLFETYFMDETYADCSLAAGTAEITAHKIILSACSPFFNTILRRHQNKHPIIVLEHAMPEDLQLIIEYMYKGEVHVPQSQLNRFLQLANHLQVAGLVTKDDTLGQLEEQEEEVEEVDEALTNKRTWDEANDISLKLNTDENVEYFFDEAETNPIKTESGLEITLDGVKFSEMVEPVSAPTVKLSTSRTPRTPKLDVSRVSRLQQITPFRGKCKDCGSIFKSESTYINHFRYDCNNVHVCEACSKVFKNKRHLLDHVRDDCGRYHVCSQCNRQFTQKVNLTTHQKHYCRPGDPKSAKLAKNAA